MKRASIISLSIVATALITSNVLAGDGSQAVCPKLQKAPTIDGTLSPDEYPSAGKQTYVDPAGNSDVMVTFWTAYDDRNFYFAAKVLDTDVVGDQTEEGSPVWGDDDIEIYVDATNEGKDVRGETDYQFLWGANGGTNKVIGNGAGGYDFDSWTPDVKSVLKVIGSINDGSDTDTGYVVEAAFPLMDFGLKATAGTVFGFNVTSFDYPSDPRGSFKSFFSWQENVPSIVNNHVPAGWGVLTLK